MSIISRKKKNEQENSTEEVNPEESVEEEIKTPQYPPLTPWQQANLEYLKQKAIEDGVPFVDPYAIKEEENTEEDEATTETEKDSKDLEAADDTTTSTDDEPEATDTEIVDEEQESDNDQDVEEEILEKGPANGSFLDRLPNLKQMRQSRLYRRSTLLITIFMIPTLFLLYYISPLSSLSGISVTGNEHIPSEKVLSDMNFSVGQNLWNQFFNRDQYIKRLKNNEERVQSASVSFNGVNHFKVQVKEFEEVAYLERDSQYFPIISNGKIIDDANARAADTLPILKNFKSSKRILKVLKQYDELNAEVRTGISQIDYAPKKDNSQLLEIYMNDGNKVMVNIPQMQNRMQYYPQIASDMAEAGITGIVDMEAGVYAYAPSESSDENPTGTTTTESANSMENE
ncbi:cell division protein FtsQ/DivIB [Enterococcus alishanensis]